MAVVVGTVQHVAMQETNEGPRRESGGAELFSCRVWVTYTGTYAQGANAATCLLVGAAIAAARRDGKTVTVLQAGCSGPGSEAGVLQGAIGVSMSGTTLQCQLTTADMATEHANAAMGAYDWGVEFTLFCKAA